MDDFLSILKESSATIEIEKSKFISYAVPVETEAEAIDFINEIKKKNYNATHNVSAYSLRSVNNLRRYSDDGEPSGTAGMPTLGVIQNKNLMDICLVTTRYFGGIKLGAGGLVRAYAESANACLSASKIIKYEKMTHYILTVSYDLFNSLLYLLKTKDILVGETTYMENVSISIYLREIEKNLLTELIDMSASTIQIKENSTRYIACEDNKILSIKELI